MTEKRATHVPHRRRIGISEIDVVGREEDALGERTCALFSWDGCSWTGAARAASGYWKRPKWPSSHQSRRKIKSVLRQPPPSFVAP
jgi:hypothetical protein